MGRHVAGPEVHLRGALIVARDEAEEDLGEEALLLHAEAAHDAEVDGNEAPGVIDEQVALVHVGVEEAVAHGVLQERAHHREAERLAVEVGGGDAVVVRKGDAVDPFDGEHAAGGALPVDLGNAEVIVARRVLRHLGDGGGLEAQVHLQLGRSLQRVDDGDGLQAPRRRMQALDEAGGEVVAVEVAAELLLDAGAQDLYGYLAPAAVGVDDGRLMHLRDGGGGDGGAELGEMILELAAERFLDGAARLGHGERR